MDENERNLLAEIAEGVEQSLEVGLEVVREFEREGDV